MGKTLDAQLVDAAGWHGTDAQVRDLLARGADPTTRSGNGALVFAAAANRLSTMKLLVDAGALIDSIDYPTNTPLMHAATVPIAKFLLDHGARVDGCDAMMMGDALHRVMDRGDDVELARLLLDHGLQLLRYCAGETTRRLESHLEKAISLKRTAIAALLLERGCDPNEITRRAEPMLGHAIVFSETIALMLFDRGVLVTPTDLALACQWRGAALTAAILKRTTGDATSAAEVAADRGDVETLRILIESDRVERLDAPLRAAARRARIDAVSLLLQCGADPLARDDSGYSSVHAAATGGSIALLDGFVAAGCSFDADARGRTALHYAATGTNPAEMLRELVRRGLDLEALDQDGATPLKLCAKNLSSSAYDTLVELGAKSTDDGERQAAIDHQEWFDSKF